MPAHPLSAYAICFRSFLRLSSTFGLVAEDTDRLQVVHFVATAARAELSIAQVLNPDRRTNLKKRLGECGGHPGWLLALDKLENSSHCTGGNDRGWRANLDFMLQPSSFIKLMEGFYDDNKPKRKSSRAVTGALNILKEEGVSR